MGQPTSPVSVLLLFLCWLDPSWEARVPQPVTLHHPATIPSNATVFSHVYTIKVAGDVAEGEGVSSSPQEALGPPGSSRGGGLFEHTLEGPDQEHVVFTHRINLPPQTCGCPPGTEDTWDLLRRLQALENEVRALRNTCQAGGGCCPATTGTQASTGQTDIRTLCSHHGSFDLSRCQCDCEAGWGGPTCAEPACPGGCGGSQRGKCVNGRCQCRPGYSGLHCEEPPSCPDDCNDQGRCVDGRCQCFEGYAGPSCSDPTCPEDCQGRGKCVSGRCVCDPGYSGDDCGSRACPGNCNRHGKCQDGRCVCEPGFTGPACGTKACPNHCHQRGRCLKGGVCECHKGYTGPDCGQRACPEDCSGHGECQNGVCLCHDGYSGDDCATEIPSIGIRVSNRDETSFRLEWNRPEVPVDGYEIHVVSTKERQEGESIRLPGTETVFEQRGLKPGEEYSVTIRTEKGQRYGPPVTQTVRTLVAPPYGLQSSRVTEDSMTLQWEPPSVHPDGYVLSYVPVGAPRPVQAAKRVELPATPETVTLRDLESNTRYRLTLIARRNGENSRATSIVVSTTAPAVPTPAKTQPIPATTLSPEVPLRDLTVTDVSPNSLRVTWSAPPDAYRSFALQYRDPKSSAPPGEIRVPGTERSVDVVGLRPRTEYELMLHGEKPSGRYDAPLTTKASTAAEIQKPTLGGISVLEITDRSARLSWDVATGTFDSFLIQYKDADGKPKSVPVSGDSREATLSDLVPSRKYKFNVYGLVGRKRFGPASTEAVTAKPDRKLTAPPSLGELSATDTTSDSVHLSWTVPSSGFDSFVIQYKDAEGRPQVLPLEGDAREVTVPSLAPSRRYRFNLYGVASRKRLGPATADVTTAAAWETAPQPVLGDLSVHEATSDSVRLAWTVPEGHFDSFLLQYRDPEGKEQTQPVNRDSREVTISNLMPSQAYRFHLYGISGNQRLGPVSADAVTVPAATTQPPKTERPDQPPLTQPSLGELSVSRVTSNSVRLSWTVPAGSFDSFLIQYKDAEGKTQMLPAKGSSRQAVVSHLTPSHRYKFNLYGVSGRKRSGPVSANATTASQEVEAPAEIQPSLGELSVSNVTSDSVHLSWTVPAGDFDSFLVQYKDAEGKTQAFPAQGGAREALVPHLAPSHRYTFNLYGVSGRQRSAPISTEATTASREEEEHASVQPSLGELSVSDVTGDSVRLSWTVRTGSFDSFLVQYKDVAGKPQALPVEGDSRQVLVTTLAPSHRYKFNLFGISGHGRSVPLSTEATTAATATSPEGEAATQPSLGELSVADISTHSVHLSWTVRSGRFDSFLLQYKDAEGKLQTLPVERDFRDIIVPNLIPSHRYTFNLYGLSGRKRSAPVSTDGTTAPVPSVAPGEAESVTTPAQPKLGELSASNISSHSLQLSWTLLAGNVDSFLIQYKDASGKLQKQPVQGGGAREATVSNLVPSRRYRFNLYGVSGLQRIGPITTEAITAPLMEKPTPPVRLGELTASNAMPNSLDLSWTVEEGSFDSFIVQYRDVHGKPQALPVDGNLRSVHLHDLAPSHRYKFNLYGILGRKRLGPIFTEGETAPLPTTPPPQPTLGELSVSNVTSYSAHLSWTVPTGDFDSFLIQYKDAEGKPLSLTVEGELREVTVPSLVPSRRYKFSLYGVSGRKRVGPVSTDMVTAPLPTTPPPQPTLGELSVSNVTSYSAHLSWTIPAGDFDSFLIQYKDAEGKPLSLTVEGELREVTVPSLVPSRRYKFNLYGVSGRKRVGPVSTDMVTASLPEEPPSLGELLVSNVTSDSVHLSWTVRTGSFETFLIQYKDAQGKPHSIPVEGVFRELAVPNLVPSRRYKFNLYGLTGRNKRLGPVSTDTITASLPAETKALPSLGQLSVSNVTTDSASLSWTVQTGSFDSFLIQYRDTEGKTQALPLEGSARRTTILGLSPSRRYKFNLIGLVGRKRIGPISAEAVTAPRVKKEEPAKPSLGEFTVSDVTSNSALLSWTIATGQFDSFLIQYKDAQGKLQALPVEGTSREVTVSDLTPARRYKFNLFGLSGRKRLGPVSSEATTVKPEEEEQKQEEQEEEEEEEKKEDGRHKPQLGELVVSEAHSDSVRLSWSVPNGSFDSFLLQYEDGEDDVHTLPVDGVSREVTVLHLVPSQRYRFELYGLSKGERLGPVSTNTITAPAAPEQQGQVTTTPTPKPKLGELSVSEVTGDSVRLSWDVPDGAYDSFLVQYVDAEDNPQEIPVDKETSSIVVYHLVPTYRYIFYLYGVSGQRHLGPISVSVVTATTGDKEEQEEEEVEKEGPARTEEPRLGELSVSEVTRDAARLSWTVPVGSFDSFSVQYKDAQGRPQALPVGGDAREVTVPNLAPSHKYKFNLFGISEKQRVGPISATAVTTARAGDERRQEVGVEADKEIPRGTEEPRLGELSVSEVTRDAARLSWTVPVGSFDSFSVQYKDAQGRPQALPVGGDTREVTVPNLAPSHKYKFNLFGISGKQRVGPISAAAVITAAETPGPAAVKEKEPPRSVLPNLGEVAVSEVTPDSLLLSWSVPEGSFDSFLIQYKDASGKLQGVPVDGAMRSLHLYNLTPSQRYEFRIFGHAGNRRLGPVSVDAVTAPEPPQEEKEEAVPPQLGDLSVSKVTSHAVGLSWSVPAGDFDSFLLQYKDTEGKPQVLRLNGDTRDVTVPNLAPSHRYKFNLYGLSGHKQLGPLSTEAVTGPRTQPEKRAPLKLGELSAHDITAESVLLNWTVEAGHFDTFIIQYRDAEGKPHALPVDGTLRSLRLHDLLPSHQYRFNLYGVYGRKRFGPVSTEALTAPLERVAPPQATLGGFSASDINGTSVRLSWDIVTGNFDSFIVQYRDAEGKPQALPIGKNLLNVVISNLVPSRKYKFNLYGISGRKRIGPISVEAVTAEVQEPEIGPTLGDLSITEVTQDSVRLSWTVSAGHFDSFLIQYKDAEGRPQSIPVGADAHTVVISNLVPSHRYKFNLYGISGRKRYGPISTDAVTAFPEAESKPPTLLLDHLVVSEVTPTSLQLTWEVPEGEVDSFLIRGKESLLGSGRSPPPAKEVTVAGDKRSAVLRGLTPNTEYSLTVYGIRDGSEVANLNTGARTSGLELGSPRDLRFSDIRETSVVANWRPPASRIDRYKVSVQPSDGGEPRSIAVDGSKLRTTLENLTPGASYEVTVVSIRGFEESEPLVGYVTTVPDGPSDLRAIDVTDSSAVLTWHPPMAEMNNYIVTYGPVGGPRASESVPGNRVQLRLSGLHRDTEYRASVYGEKEGNRSSPVSATFTTGADGPRDLQAREISARSARLTWSPPRAPPGGYLLSYESPSGQSKEIPLDASVTSYELQDLIPSSRYKVQVQALRRGTPTAPTSTSFTTEHMTYPFPRDCSEESMNAPRPSRVATIYLGGNRERPLQVYCDMETDGGGWIVFQRRMNGETNFWRDWQDYATGFGNLTREFWLGNDALHQLTSSGDYELRVDLRAGNESVYATYQSFRVDPPAEHYRLHLGSYNGTAGDAFSYHSGSVFSTRDRDPNRLIIPCAVSYRGAWWYRNCHYTNLNGLYANNRDHQGVNWFNWKGFEFSIPFTEMKLRPRGFQPLWRAA